MRAPIGAGVRGSKAWGGPGPPWAVLRLTAQALSEVPKACKVGLGLLRPIPPRPKGICAPPALPMLPQDLPPLRAPGHPSALEVSPPPGPPSSGSAGPGRLTVLAAVNGQRARAPQPLLRGPAPPPGQAGAALEPCPEAAGGGPAAGPSSRRMAEEKVRKARR